MKTYKEYLVEIHYKDIWGDEFETFRKKYSKLKNDESYFINFTNFNTDKLERNAYGSPDHKDPIGVYGYPLKYVITNPADIWYGFGAKYIRILKSKSDKTLILNYISKYNCEKYLYKLFGHFSTLDNAVKQLKRLGAEFFRSTSSSYYGKVFFSLIQIDFEKSLEENKLIIRNGEEQTKLIKKLGFNAVRDVAKNQKQAIINDREPEQIIFLDRYAFEIVEVFKLKKTSEDYIMNTIIPEKIERPLVVNIAKIMDDMINDGPERMNRGGWSDYWTKKGRKISIYFEDNTDRSNLKWGEKKHKAVKLYSNYTIEIKVKTEHGEIYNYGSSFDDILDSIKDKWNSIKTKDVDKNWKPISRKSEKEIEDEEKRIYYEKERIRKYKDYIEVWKRNIDSIKKIANHFKIDIPEIDVFSEEYNINDYIDLDFIFKQTRGYFYDKDLDTIKQFVEKYDDIVIHEKGEKVFFDVIVKLSEEMFKTINENDAFIRLGVNGFNRYYDDYLKDNNNENL